MRAQLANTPADIVVANHCYGLFELAAIYLSQNPPALLQARLPIDALGYLLDGLKGRLGEAEPALVDLACRSCANWPTPASSGPSGPTRELLAIRREGRGLA